MVNPKKLQIERWIIFLYLVLFPFGQMIRLSTTVFNRSIVFHPIDLVALASLIYFLYKKPFSHLGYFEIFLISSLFSSIIAINYFGLTNVLLGLLYLLRLVAHSSLFYLAYYQVKINPSFKIILFKGMVLISVFVALFGWIQYFLYPDLRALIYIGWDDHLYRLVGTFLDPGLTSIFLVLGGIASIDYYLIRKERRFLIISVFLIISLAFTYSRGGYLAFLAGTTFLLIKSKRIVTLVLTIASFIFLVLVLPRPSSEGVKLERIQSINLRYYNYIETFYLWSRSPLFGFGYNNLCSARISYFGDLPSSHSCSGSDSSILFLLASGGVMGFLFFSLFLMKLLKQFKAGYLDSVVMASIIAIGIHSQFANSLFYTWVVGWMALLTGLGKSISNRQQ